MIVYLATNKINNKKYIGQTTQSLEKRIKNHLNQKNKYDFQKDLHKYGLENFKFEILCKCITRDELNEKEKYYIKYYNTIDVGYNIYAGGFISEKTFYEKTIRENKEYNNIKFKQKYIFDELFNKHITLCYGKFCYFSYNNHKMSNIYEIKYEKEKYMIKPNIEKLKNICWKYYLKNNIIPTYIDFIKLIIEHNIIDYNDIILNLKYLYHEYHNELPDGADFKSGPDYQLNIHKGTYLINLNNYDEINAWYNSTKFEIIEEIKKHIITYKTKPDKICYYSTIEIKYENIKI